MQVRTIQGGEQAISALLYKQQDPSLLQYLQNNIQAGADALGGVADNFVNQAKLMYDKFNNSALINASKALLYSTGTHFSQDIIIPVAYDNLGTTNLIMQQYIIAQPDVNKLYQDNMCSGYDGVYLDRENGITGTDRYDYRRVMDGVIQHDDNHNGEAYIMHYSQDDEEEELSFMDKSAILDTWANVVNALANGIDPTDPDMEQL